MTHFNRLLDLKPLLQKKSHFLLGPRQTGKTDLLKTQFPKAPYYNLLQSDTFLKLSQRPSLLREEVLAKPRAKNPIILLDEIQKLPILLDEVQILIQEHGYHFLLTGSSARKLKRGSANLLGGRAWMKHLFPLVSAEIPQYNLLKILNFGALPSVYLSADPVSELEAYVGLYLQEEIAAEGLVRRIENFSRFLQSAALMNGELINFENIASDAQVPPRSVREYFYILEDTLIGNLLQPYTKTKKRKAISTAKFYFFDLGVSNILANRTGIKPKTDLFGRALEHFIFMELHAYLSYSKKNIPLYFWRSRAGHEVDFVLGDEVAIEVKGSEMVSERHLTGLKALEEEKKWKKQIVVSMDKSPRKIKNIHILPVSHFLEALWQGDFC